MIARGITIADAAPTPCTKRKKISHSMLGARPQPIEPMVNSARPKYSGGLRPTMSEIGP